MLNSESVVSCFEGFVNTGYTDTLDGLLTRESAGNVRISKNIRTALVENVPTDLFTIFK